MHLKIQIFSSGIVIVEFYKYGYVLGQLVSNTTVRVLKPQCELDKRWTEEPLIPQVSRVIKQLEKLSLPANVHNNNDEEDNDSADSDLTGVRLPASTFAFVFYLLNCVLSNAGSLVSGDEGLRKSALALILEHAQMRRTNTVAEAKVRLE